MAVYPKLTVLPVGQGSCNLIEVYDSLLNGVPAGNLIFLAMTDCGTKSSVADPSENVPKSLNYIVNKMQERAECLNDPHPLYYLDTFDLTHQDADHWNLLKPLIWKMYNVNNGSIKFKHNNVERQIEVQGSNLSTYTHDITNGRISYSAKGTMYYDGDWDYIVQASCDQNSQDSPTYVINLTSSKNSVKDDDLNIEIKPIGNSNQNNYNIDIVINYLSFTHKVKFYFNEIRYEIGNNYLHIEIPNNIRISKSYSAFYNIKNVLTWLKEGIYIDWLKSQLTENVIPAIVWERLSIALISSNIKINNWNDITNRQNIFATEIKPFINNTSYTGLFYSQKAEEIVAFLEVCSFNPNMYYSPIGPLHPMEHSVQFQKQPIKRYLLSNLDLESINWGLDNRRAYGTFRNASGSMFAWKFNEGMSNECTYVFTGDATVQSMFHICFGLQKGALKGCIMTAPHHGSDHSSADTGNNTWNILEEFFITVNPSAIVVSAGQLSQHGHPGINLMNKALKSLPQPNPTSNYHSICWCVNPGAYKIDRLFAINRTQHNLYTTVQYHQDTNQPIVDPPPVINNKLSVTNAMKADENNTKYVGHRFNLLNHE